jgi:hypothetical protein
MKKQYEAPSVEVVRFRYSDQIVASSGGGDGGGTTPSRESLLFFPGCWIDYSGN